MRLCITRGDQLLLYIKRGKGVKKCRVIYALEITFILLDKNNEPMLSASTGCAVEGIGGNTVLTAFSISTCNIKSLSTNMSRI